MIQNKQRCFIGVDNGVSGSIGIIFEDGTYKFYNTPVKKVLNYTKAKAYINRVDGVVLSEILSQVSENSSVMIERPMVNPTRFAASVSALRAFEATVIVLELLRLSYEVIDSKAWQKVLLPSGVSGDELKSASLDVGNRLFPLIQSKHKDRDSILMAEYCRRMKR